MTISEKITNKIGLALSGPQGAMLHTGRPRMVEQSDEYGMFLTAFPNEGPVGYRSIASHKGIRYEEVRNYFKDGGWELIRVHELHSADDKRTNLSWEVLAHSSGIIVALDIATGSKEHRQKEIIRVINSMAGGTEINTDKIMAAIGGVTRIDTIKFISKTQLSEDQQKIWDELRDICGQHIIPADRSPKLGIISHDGSDYYVKNFSMSGKAPDFNYPDLHYGEGFEDFHKALIDRIFKESKGLVLLHGDPGTGKTQYIRVLLDNLGAIGKSVLYVPPSFSSQMTEPSMIEFISSWIIDEEQDCILLIEDAEPLLEIRNGTDGRTTGISNLLNMTDGLLNDILGIMVIATFNTNIAKIDPALLRPQRLVARKEFGRISKKQAVQLSEALGIPTPEIDYPATLAEFYTSKKSQDILIHQVPEERKIGFM